MPDIQPKVAVVAQPLDVVRPKPAGSIGILCEVIARGLSSRFDVTVITRQGRRRRREEREGGVRYLHLAAAPDNRTRKLLLKAYRTRDPHRPFFASRFYYPAYAWLLARALRSEGFDVVHLHNYPQFVPVVRALNPQLKIVLHMHCEWLVQLDPALIERYLRGADLILGVSDFITHGVRQHFPPCAGRCETLYNGIPVDDVPPAAPGRDASAGPRRLLFTGRVSPEKGVHVILEAFRRVAESDPDAELHVVGPRGLLPKEYTVALSDVPRVAALAEYYRDGMPYPPPELTAGLEGRVVFTGNIPHDQLAKHYAEADVFLHPSVWGEPFPLCVLEAMAAGLPVIGSRAGGLPESIEDGRTGLLVEPSDASGLAEAMMRLLGDASLRARMGEAGRQRVLDRFTREHMVEAVLDLYARLVGPIS